MKYPQRNALYKAHVWLSVIAIAGMSFAGCSRKAQVTSNVREQTAFATPAEAGEALQTASRAHDESALSKILGEGSAAILSSGDPAEDKASIDAFTKKYDRMNRWVTLTDGSEILYVGADNYPFPIPLAKNASGRWYFDTAAGEDELLARRIGRNELLAIDAANAIAKAQDLYSKEFAQNVVRPGSTHRGSSARRERRTDFIGMRRREKHRARWKHCPALLPTQSQLVRWYSTDTRSGWSRRREQLRRGVRTL